MILVDTSILLDYFRGRDTDGVERFDEVQDKSLTFGISDYTYAELLQGCATQKEFKSLQHCLDTQRFYTFQKARESYMQASRLYFRCRQAGITIRSTMDCWIAQIAIENELFLLHSDKDFDRIASIIPELKIY